MTLQIRPAGPDDHAAYGRLRAEMGVPDALPPARQWAAEMAPTTRMAELGGSVVGYVYFQALADSGYVRNLAVAPAARRRGVGRALLQHAADELRARGLPRWQLNVRPDNTAAIVLYETLGLERDGEAVSLAIDWLQVAMLPRPRPLEVMAVARGDETAIEACFELPAGLLTSGRQREGRILRVARTEEGELVGVALFDPGFPGAYPFRIADARDAAALLDGLTPHARPDTDWLVIVAENHPALAALLLAHGAREQMRVVHMSGPL